MTADFDGDGKTDIQRLTGHPQGNGSSATRRSITASTAMATINGAPRETH